MVPSDARAGEARTRTIRLVLCVGLLGSLALVLWVGRRNPSIILMAAFVAWVAAPFATLLAANEIGSRWSRTRHAAVRALAIVISLLSLTIYAAVALLQPRTPAGAFLMVPLASLVVSAGVLLLTARR